MSPHRAAAAYRWVLRLYPPGFRRRFGRDMTELFVDRFRRAAPGERAALWMRTVGDAVRHVPGAWTDDWRERRLETARRQRRGRSEPMDTIARDLRYAARTLAGQPAFTAVALLTLAIGIGGTTAMFSVVDAVLLRRLPYPAADRLVRLNDSVDGGRASVAYPNFLDWRSIPAIERAAAFTRGDVNFAVSGEAERVQGITATPEIFELTGIGPVAGRTFVAADEQPDQPAVVVLTEGLWERRFGRDPSILGRTAIVDGQAEAIVGIVPAVPGIAADVWRPLRRTPLLTRRNHFLTAVARLAPAASIAQARAELATVGARLQREYPDTNGEWTAAVTPLDEDLSANSRPMAIAGLGAIALVLLIGAANVANLLLSRAIARRREFAIRAALGASRRRLARQLLTESLLLSLAGGAAGVALAYWATRAWGTYVEQQFRLVNRVAIDPMVLGFAVAVSSAVGLAFGLAPALEAARRDPNGVLKANGDAPSRRGWPSLTSLLTIAEFALSIVLLTGAGLFANSLVRLAHVDPGFDPDGVLTIRLSPPRVKYASAAAAAGFYRSAFDSLRSVPGIQAVAATSGLAVTSGSTQRGYIRDGDPIPGRREVRLALYHLVTPDYFAVLRIGLEGRAFNPGDTAASEPVAIVSQSMARDLWGDAPVLGRRIRIHTDEPFARTIVGVARDVKHVGLDRPSYPAYYVPFEQAPRLAMSLVLRSDGRLDRIVPEVRRRIAAIDPDLPLYDIQAYDRILRTWFAPRELTTSILGAFAIVAVLLAAIGIYGVMAAAVSRRVREIGVRLAVGAGRADVFRLIVGDGLRQAAIGMIVGAPLAFAAARSVAGRLYGVAPWDPWTYAAAMAALGAAAAAACYLPARRAARVDPLVTLKAE